MTARGARFMFAHPAHLLALGFGSGLSPVAPGTAGTLWAWLAFVALQPWMTDSRWALLLATTLLLGTWASTVTARNMQVLREISAQTADSTQSTSLAIARMAGLSTDLRSSVAGFRLPRPPGPDHD